MHKICGIHSNLCRTHNILIYNLHNSIYYVVYSLYIQELLEILHSRLLAGAFWWQGVNNNDVPVVFFGHAEIYVTFWKIYVIIKEKYLSLGAPCA